MKTTREIANMLATHMPKYAITAVEKPGGVIGLVFRKDECAKPVSLDCSIELFELAGAPILNHIRHMVENAFIHHSQPPPIVKF